MQNKRLVLATRNQGKVKEIHALLPDYEILTLDDIGYEGDIEETGLTLQENAALKAETVFRFCHISTLGDDSGLEVEMLNGQPGVYSARYAGPESNSRKNIEKLLAEMGNSHNRKARFRTVLALAHEAGTRFFEGICQGEITRVPFGSGGFGYDPVFIPDGYKTTFAEMSAAEKNSISHRAKALEAFRKMFG